jgi:hypothetical protein
MQTVRRTLGISQGHHTANHRPAIPARIALITGNAYKAAEHAAMLGIEVTPAKAELTEIQSLDVADVAAARPLTPTLSSASPSSATPPPTESAIGAFHQPG